jgi:hypothetical protein
MKNNILFSAMLVSLLAFGLTLTSCGRGLLNMMGGPSKSQLEAAAKIQSAPSIEAVDGLENKLIWLQANAQSGGSYVIELNSDEKITGAVVDPYRLLSRSNSDITITLRGVGANRTISHTSSLFSHCPDAMFVVGTGITLVLDNNITLKPERCYMPVVEVKGRGTLVMNDGSVIIGSRSQTGGGVYVGDGTFLMKGGTISGSTSRRGYSMGGGDKSGKYFIDPTKKLGGGGVWVDPNGTFIKTGGTITNNSVEDIRKELLFQCEDSYGRIIPYEMEIRVPEDERGPQISITKRTKTGGGMRFIDEKGYTQVNGFGSQIYFDGPNPKAIDATVGPDVTLNFSNGVFREGRNESKPKEAVAEPENNNHESSVNGSAEITPITQQEALQEYQTAAQKMQATQREALLEYQATIQKNPAAAQEAALKYQKTLQEAQRELQEAAKKYQETVQNKR